MCLARYGAGVPASGWPGATTAGALGMRQPPLMPREQTLPTAGPLRPVRRWKWSAPARPRRRESTAWLCPGTPAYMTPPRAAPALRAVAELLTLTTFRAAG